MLDPAVRLLDLQSEIALPDVNLLVFEHGCGSSISILSRRLRHLLREPRPGDPTVRLMGTAECRGHCRYLADLEACDAPCSNARDRKLILLVERMKEGELGGAADETLLLDSYVDGAAPPPPAANVPPGANARFGQPNYESRRRGR